MKIAVVTPWFPREVSPYSGTFVREWVRSMGLHPDQVCVIHCVDVPVGADFPVQRESHSWGKLIRVPVAHDPMLSRADTAERHRVELRSHVAAELAGAEVIHAHVGMPSGVATAELLRHDQRLITIEHATYLPTLLAHPVAREVYGKMLNRTSAHLVVGEDTARMVRRAFPEVRDRVHTAGNPVDVDVFSPSGPGMTPTKHSDGTDSRWLFVGNFIERKGVLTLLESFALACARFPGLDLSLTMVGAGLLESQLREFVRVRGLTGQVAFLGPRSGREVAELMRSHGTLVHLSQFETFGLTVVEAIAAGARVIATTCAGPEETLRGAAGAGRASLVPLDATPSEVVDAWATLIAVPGDPVAARQSIVDLYGATPFGERLLRVSRGETWHRAEPARSRILVAAATPGGEHAIRYAVPELLGRDSEVAVVVGGMTQAVMTDPRATVVNVQPQLGGSFSARAETWFVDTAPAWAVDMTARALKGAGAALPAAQRVSNAGHRLVKRVGRGWERRRAPRRARVRARMLASPDRWESIVTHVSEALHGRAIDCVVWADDDNRGLAEHIAAQLKVPAVAAESLTNWAQ
ncbi:glycosyltransferase [Demequina globuliformis]|uniref:glycosyltransferase n=1 Tax=Demequina globuliformis TaxID=676202 RepID=UPI000784E998|nr:glycosyltransferase [Demequina globuliformis]